MTFNKAAAAYIQAHKAGWRGARTAHRWQSELERYAYPAFGKRDVATVTVDDVLHVLAPIWTTKNETASKVRERIEAVLDWAAAKGYRSGVNPAMWRGNLKHLLPARARVHTVRHHPALPWQELPAFMAELRGRDALAARALETTILTACRTSEVLNADRSELNGDLWVIPAERMKARKEHRVPLSTHASAIISSVPCLEGNSYVFPGHRDGRPLSGMAMEMLLRRMGRSDITVHGFRSTFRDWAAEATDFPREISGSEVERAYRRSDLLLKRKGLMQKWADYCCQT
jgi:integrase